jgi:catechol 2,3-dioxygenase-like lactoylglutathione lyase family enzyme
MAHGFHHVHIKSPNPRKTAQWWADVFDAKLLPEHGAFSPVELDGVLINISGVSQKEAQSMAQGTAAGNFGLEHVGLTTDDLDADLARLREHGLEIFVLRDTPTMRMAFVETPDNVRVELIQPIN